MRDITLDDTFYHFFTTRAFATGVPTTLLGSPVLSVLEENNATPITAGVSVQVDRASVTGLNQATIIATSGNGYETGKSYAIYISTGTVGGTSVVGEVVGTFTVQASSAFIRLGAPAGASVSADVAAVKADTGAIKTKTDFTPSVTAGAAGGLQIAGSNAATTYATLTVTGALTLTGNVALADGLTIAAPSTAGRAGLTITGNGAGAGIIATGGVTGNGFTLSAGATSGHGISATATGTSFNGLNLVGSPTTGMGILTAGGSTSGSGIKATSITGDAILTAVTTSGHGATFAGTGTTKHGINATGGATTSHGIAATGGGVGHGILATSGGGATGDGIRAAAASTDGNGATFAKTGSGSDLNATVTPLVLAKTTNLTGLNDIAATAVVSAGAITTSGGIASADAKKVNGVTIVGDGSGTPFNV